MESGALARAQLTGMLNAWKASTDPTAGKVILFTNDINPDDTTILGDLIQPTGDWYAAMDIDWGRVIEQDSGGMGLDAGAYRWDYTGTDPAETIRGWGVTNTGITKLLLSRKLRTPVVMANVLDSVLVEPDLVVPAILATA